MAGITQKMLWNYISIVVPNCPLDNCAKQFYQWSLVIRPYENNWWQRGFFQPSRIATKSFILVVAGFLDPSLFFVFFSSVEVWLNECFTLSYCYTKQQIAQFFIASHCYHQLSHTGREAPAIVMYYAHNFYPVKSSAFIIILPWFNHFTFHVSFLQLY